MQQELAVSEDKPTKVKKKTPKPSWAGARVLMGKPQPNTIEAKERNIINITAKALSISPFGVNILGDLPYINKLGLATKAREYEPAVQFKYDWVKIAQDDTEKAICKCKLVDGKGKDLSDWVLGECSPSTIRMSTLKGYQNHLAQTRAKNRAILETFGDRIHTDLVVNIEKMLKNKEMSEKEAIQIGSAVSSSVEEMQDEKQKKGALIMEQDAFLKLKQMAREYGAERGKEKEYIEEHIGENVDWVNLTDKDIAIIKTRFMSVVAGR